MAHVLNLHMSNVLSGSRIKIGGCAAVCHVYVLSTWNVYGSSRVNL